MNFADLDFVPDWIRYRGQTNRQVIYVFVASNPIIRLRGQSDILYVGRTSGSIRKRFNEETATNNTSGNTQNTNIRTTYIFGKMKELRIDSKCYFTQQDILHLTSRDASTFSDKMRTWDKRAYRNTSDFAKPNIEKYILINYANEHLELPPLNNSF